MQTASKFTGMHKTRIAQAPSCDTRLNNSTQLIATNTTVYTGRSARRLSTSIKDLTKNLYSKLTAEQIMRPQALNQQLRTSSSRSASSRLKTGTKISSLKRGFPTMVPSLKTDRTISDDQENTRSGEQCIDEGLRNNIYRELSGEDKEMSGLKMIKCWSTKRYMYLCSSDDGYSVFRSAQTSPRYSAQPCSSERTLKSDFSPNSSRSQQIALTKEITLIKQITLSLAILLSHVNQLSHANQLSSKQIVSPPAQEKLSALTKADHHQQLSFGLRTTNNPRLR
ncbi:hypothetical protein F511_22213 [Dorcoceras hygrometricum]|uniref:Uncharacterized protein n=1 Tax=Dorcoceras hygrometricum TaxID=472368 RepID=A0A2Z7AVS2_9LAMI|nr:hypothetical protein F511_22213 [Dorcoceras hygrometricum]